MSVCVARACRHLLSRVHPYRAGAQSEPDCSSPSLHVERKAILRQAKRERVRKVARRACQFREASARLSRLQPALGEALAVQASDAAELDRADERLVTYSANLGPSGLIWADLG